MSVGNHLLKQIAKLVDNNDHGEAIVVGARALGLTDLAERVERINRQQLRLGHLPPSQYHARQSAYEEMMAFAKKALLPADFKRFYGVF